MSEADVPSNEENISRYAARILEVKAQRDARVDEATLLEIARELGLSDADLAAVARVANDTLARARGYVAHGRFADAIGEFETACALQPHNVEARYGLAAALGARFADGGDSADLGRAQMLAKECLQIEPLHQPSFALLNALEKPQRRTSGVVVAAAVLFGVVGVVGVVAVVAAVGKPSLVEVRPPPAAVAVPIMAAPTPGQEAGEAAQAELPVELVLDEHSRGLRLETRGAQLARYPTSAFFELRALIHNERDAEVREVEVRIDIVDKNGAVVATATAGSPAGHEAALRKGDAAPLDALLATPPTATAALLTVQRVVQEPVSSWPAAPEIELHWGVPRPAGVNVGVSQRSSSIRPALFGLGPYFNATWAFQNRATTPLSTLKVELRAFDAAGQRLPPTPQSIGDGTRYVTSSSSHPVVRSGETRLLRVIETVDPACHHVEVWVVAVD